MLDDVSRDNVLATLLINTFVTKQIRAAFITKQTTARCTTETSLGSARRTATERGRKQV